MLRLHSNSCHKSSIPGRCAVDLPTDRRVGVFGHCLRPHPQVCVRIGRDVLAIEQHGLAVHAVHAWLHHLAHLCRAVLHLFLPRVAAVPARKRQDAKALKIIQQILHTNKSKLDPLFTQDDFREAARRIAEHEGRVYNAEEEEHEGLHAGGRKTTRWESTKKSAKEMVSLFLNAKTLFRNKTMSRVTTIVWITFIADFGASRWLASTCRRSCVPRVPSRTTRSRRRTATISWSTSPVSLPLPSVRL